jgi:aspartate kinase
MPIAIMKFGGGCLVNAEAFSKIQTITELNKDVRKIYVASALNGITDNLVQLAKFANNHEQNSCYELLKIIEKRHLDIIDEIFNDNPEVKQQALDFIRDKLIEISQALEDITEFGLQPYFSDLVLSFGEKMSTYLLTLYLKKCGYDVQFFTGDELIITDDNYTDALPDLKLTFHRFRNRIVPMLEEENSDVIFCITGFIGRNKIGYTTTLGRGGSDFTATIIARAAYETCRDQDVSIILWKDVDGILTANPKLVDNPQLIYNLSYDEAKEMAFFGAKILHPKCLSVIEDQKIKVFIKNFNNPGDTVNFSTISEATDACNLKGVSTIERVAMISVNSGTLVNVPGVLGKIFTIMGSNNINVSMVSQSSSEVNTTFVVDLNDGQRAVNILNEDPFFKKDWFSIRQDPVGIIAVIGCQIHASANKSKIFNALSKIQLDAIAIAQASDGLNLSIIVPCDRVKDAANAINEEFQLDDAII